ncbi:KEOPS complex subunit Pcc1 [Halapricum hydrolyticum]|uniref:KEOPS complex subunit Pcc1 n=1 Tax=Halapricum hydrolyticum TaxID=2979991 RepID=A0AAE3LFK9_9EURY|nr:KEOPS complex subunit Pcc1 [Halapricum hydrolyticum]MCU4718755.1 KEOPS complex subunit Pcc1 [Halapricum hydrolyticum]MCU4727742.1 KEOPS complex subunit Pcc1 [Halapricum hydrolyticum]
MDHEAVFTAVYESDVRARRVKRSVELEAGDIEGDRTVATVDRDGNRLTITIEAADLIALRAGINTWLSLVDVAERCSGVDAVAID